MVSENSTSVYQTSSYKQEENNTELNEGFFVYLYHNTTSNVNTIESKGEVIA